MDVLFLYAFSYHRLKQYFLNYFQGSPCVDCITIIMDICKICSATNIMKAVLAKMKNSPLYQMQPSTECCTVVSSCSRYLISICFLFYRFPPSKCQYSMPAEYNQPSLDYFYSVLPSFVFKFHHLQRFFVYLGNLQVFLLGTNSAAMATEAYAFTQLV